MQTFIMEACSQPPTPPQKKFPEMHAVPGHQLQPCYATGHKVRICTGALFIYVTSEQNNAHMALRNFRE